ncbi:MAG: AEC family transporter [Spirochaetota bacterium]
MSAYLIPVFYAVLQLIILIAVGFVARRLGNWTDEFFVGMSRFVVRVALPLYFVARVGRTDIGDLRSLLPMPIAALAMVALGLGLSYGLFALLPYRGANRRAGIAMAAFGNSGYMPLTLAEIVPISVPIIADILAPGITPVHVAAYLFVFSPLLWSVGNLIITAPEAGHREFKVSKLISPPLVGILVGVAVSMSGVAAYTDDPRLPVRHLFEAVGRLSAITLPLALVSLGALIGGLKVPRGAFGHYIGLALAVAGVRFLFIPAVFFALYATGKLEFLGPAIVFALFLEMHTPPATNFSLMVGDAGVNTEHTAVTLLVGYVTYLIAMPVYLVLFLSLSPGV